jgi:hypothetical protein
MAATRVIEEAHGTSAATRRRPHNGYYAGDFRSERHFDLTALRYAFRTLTPSSIR